MTWTGEERRLEDKLLDEKPDDDLSIKDIAKMLKRLSVEVVQLRKEFSQHSATETEFRDSVYAAFPERDFTDHHNYHLEKRDAKRQNKEILLEGKKKVFGGIIWGAFLLIGYGALEWIKKQLNP